jgi:hypothetical protein
MQTDRFTILLGPAQKSLRVPKVVGWDYFKRSQTKEEDTSTISSGGTCSSDDHPDIAGWVCIECSSPQGAQVNMPPKEDSVEGQEKVSTEEDVMPGNAPVVVLEDPPSEDATPEDDAGKHQGRNFGTARRSFDL